MSQLKKIIFAFALSCCLLTSSCTSTETTEQQIQSTPPTGISYQNVKHDNFSFHTFIVDPSLFQFQVYQNKSVFESLNLKKIHQNNESILTFNGSFFDRNFQPLGLLISENKILAEFQKSELSNGILTIDQNNQANLILSEEYQKKLNENLNFAIQNGPILVNKKGESTFNNETGKKAARTILALNQDQKVVLIIHPNNLLQENQPTLFQVSQLLADPKFIPGQKLHSALNLDGGPSTGFAFLDQYFPELDLIQNAVIIKPNNSKS